MMEPYCWKMDQVKCCSTYRTWRPAARTPRGTQEGIADDCYDTQIEIGLPESNWPDYKDEIPNERGEEGSGTTNRMKQKQTREHKTRIIPPGQAQQPASEPFPIGTPKGAVKPWTGE